MPKILIYSFKSFPQVQQLGDAFVFSKLKKDLAVYKDLLLRKKPTYLVGLARGHGPTRLELFAINQFNRNGAVVVRGAPDRLYLYVPKKHSFKVAQRPTYTFCNWTMFQLQHFIKSSGLPARMLFLHVNPKELKQVSDFLAEL
jgi:hypothetical protein